MGFNAFPPASKGCREIPGILRNSTHTGDGGEGLGIVRFLCFLFFFSIFFSYFRFIFPAIIKEKKQNYIQYKSLINFGLVFEAWSL